jgi:FtsH-binding integral membrane protein
MQPELKPVRTDDQGFGRGQSYELPRDDVAVSANSQKVLRNTYLLLAISLVPTAIGAAIGYNLDFSFMRASPIVSSLALLAVFYGWIFAIEKNRNSGLGVGLLLGFTLFLGLLLGPLFQSVLGLKNGVELVVMAAGGTAAAFFGLASVASVAKRDFSWLSNFIMVGFFVIMAAVVVNIFLQVPLIHLVLLGAFILFSSAIILWQVNSIVRGGETSYISATLTLYVAIYNLFSSLLQLLGIFGGDRD